ncbi:MAG: hypothetical protein ABJC13_14630 [Acidobacteriota bacterium]
MSASSPRRLPLLLLVVVLAFPTQASAAPWDLGNLLAKAGRFFSALWAPSGCEIEPSGRRGASPDGRSASDSGRPRSKPPLGEVGCEINPNGLCGT